MLRLSEAPQSWWDRNVQRMPKEVPFNRLARASKKNPRCQPLHPRCQPPYFCYQLCTPKGVRNNHITCFSGPVACHNELTMVYFCNQFASSLVILWTVLSCHQLLIQASKIGPDLNPIINHKRGKSFSPVNKSMIGRKAIVDKHEISNSMH